VPGGVEGEGLAIALAARVLENGEIVLGVSRAGEARRHGEAKAESD